MEKDQYSTKRVLPESSREAKFSGVPKNNCAARGLGARVLANPSRMALKKMVAKQGPLAHEKIRSHDDHVEHKMLVQIKYSVVSRVGYIPNIFRRGHALAGLY